MPIIQLNRSLQLKMKHQKIHHYLKIKASQDEVGSGVVYKKSGDTLYIVTNAHVVGDKENQK